MITFAPLVLGVALAIWIIAAVGAPRTRAVAAAASPPLASARALSDCASCHPRQSAEWSRSVMAHAIESPLFESLEMVVEEQVARDADCPGGAGTLRTAGAGACTSRRTGLSITGAGGEGWCVNCHAPGENLAASLPAWNAHERDARSRRPLRDLLSPAAMEGISCAACHQVSGPVHPGDAASGRYEGNPSWISADTGVRFLSRPEDERGLFGIANSGYSLDPRMLVGGTGATGDLVPGGAHRKPSAATHAYLGSSEFCGACHDVRLFGTDALAGAERGEHFKRLRNAYSEWASWADGERRAGRTPASCQDCHMSLYPGVCVAAPAATAASGGCPAGTVLQTRAPGSYPTGRSAAGSLAARITTHTFTGVDVPLSRLFDPAAIDDPTLDVAGVPLGARQRRDLLLASAFRFALDDPRRAGDHLEIPVVIENTGAGHRVPAGFSQEREIWVHLVVTDSRGRVVYEVGKVDHGDQDLRDKVFLRVNTRDGDLDRLGRPLGVFGADVADGPDVPRWTATRGSTSDFRGTGLVNFQNGFLRCVRCIGTIDADGVCQAGPGQGTRRGDRFEDGDYDADTGECRSNLTGARAFFEVYFPIASLDATRGIAKGPDAIVDTRSLPPARPARYTFDLPADGTGPYTVDATLEFRAFPPYLVRAFIDYEAAEDRRGLRPSGPLVDRGVLDRLEVVDVATAHAVIK